MEIIYILAGLVLGIIIGLLIGKLKSSTTSANLVALQCRYDDAEAKHASDLAALQCRYNDAEAKHASDLAALQSRYNDAEAKHASDMEQQSEKLNELFQQRLNDKETAHQNAITEQQKRFEALAETIKQELVNKSNEVLKQREKELSETNSNGIDNIIKPLKESLEKTIATIADNTQKQGELHKAMETQVQNIISETKSTKSMAEELAEAFKHKTKIQGNFGEVVLKELLDKGGLTEGVHYDSQATICNRFGNAVTTEDGKRMVPDIIFHLDETRELIIDSKVSLSAYCDYVNANDEATKEQYLKEHIKSIKNHVEELSKKNYSKYIQSPKQSIDFVIMFVPHADALLTALNNEPTLWRTAMNEKNVFIADEQSLFAAIRVIALTWTSIQQTQNQQEVFRLANEMLDRIGDFEKYYREIGDAMEKAKKAYDNGYKKITDGGQSINKSAHKLIDLGGKTNPNKPLLD